LIQGELMPESRVRFHVVQSPHQSESVQIRVLVPDRLEAGRRYRALYVLPVESGTNDDFGDGLAEVAGLDLHNRHALVCMSPTFAELPWYADHPTDPRIRQESHLLAVLPFVEARYPILPTAAGRLLVGFSKSGWGAYSLLLRHPHVFGRAAAWDAPFDLQTPEYPGVIEIFGTQENFDQYRPSRLLRRQAAALAGEVRLGLHGYADFREDHEHLHALMDELAIPHHYRHTPRPEHSWSSGWLPDAVAFLARP
jgi:hypothetical protein